jgi:hypothetical protein
MRHYFLNRAGTCADYHNRSQLIKRSATEQRSSSRSIWLRTMYWSRSSALTYTSLCSGEV